MNEGAEEAKTHKKDGEGSRQELHVSGVLSDNSPLLCYSVQDTLTCSSNYTSLFPDQQFVLETASFNTSTLSRAIDTIARAVQLNDVVQAMLPLSKRLALECHEVLQKAGDLEDTPSEWSSYCLYNLLSPNPAERTVAVLLTTARLEFALGCMGTRRLHLKDTLQSSWINEVIGQDLALVLQCMLGCVKGFNLKNLAWHGFLSASNVPLELCSLLYCSIKTLEARTRDGSLKKRDLSVLPSLNELAQPTDLPFTLCEEVISASPLIHPDHTSLWVYFLGQTKQFWNTQSSRDRVPIISLCVILLQNSLRRLWVSSTGSDPARCSAQKDEFYITLDEIFSPVVPDTVPRPGASYFSTVYSTEAGGTGADHVLTGVLGERTLHALLDLLVHGAGPRLRDKLSHCECGEVDQTTFRHVVWLSLCVLARSCSPEVRDRVGGLVGYCDSYKHEFHPSAIMNTLVGSIENHTNQMQDLMEGYDAKIENCSYPFTTELDSLREFVVTRTNVYSTELALFIGPSKMKYYNLLIDILRNFQNFSIASVVFIKQRLSGLKEHTLGSRQRQGLSKLAGSLPAILRALDLVGLFKVYVTVEIRCLDVNKLDFESNKVLVKFLKGVLKCAGNCVSLVPQGKWADVGNMLVAWLKCWKEIRDRRI